MLNYLKIVELRCGYLVSNVRNVKRKILEPIDIIRGVKTSVAAPFRRMSLEEFPKNSISRHKITV